MHKRAIFRFRQDLRVYDNLGLTQAYAQSQEVVPIFILDETLIPTFGGLEDDRFGFLRDALLDLDIHLKELGSQLFIFKGKPETLIPKLCKDFEIDALYLNAAYDTPGMQRDFAIKGYCNAHDISFSSTVDILLQNPETIKPYKVFTPYFKTWIASLPERFEMKKLGKFPAIDTHILKQLHDHSDILDTAKLKKLITMPNIHRPVDGRKQRIDEFDFTHYEQTKNFPAIDGSSRLSPYIRFGLISIRHLFNVAKEQKAENYLFELGRREFRHQIAIYFPTARIDAFQEERKHLKRQNDTRLFKAFCNAKTGYPIIDAAITQLKTEHRMHNRIRMVVASFLTKDLLIDRKRGEQFFKDYLLDYEEVVNVGNRQWSASVGADPKPMRIFSPIRQSQRFDPDAIYIKKYLPQLKDIPAEQLHDPLTFKLGYCTPIVDHKHQTILAKQMYFGMSKRKND